jgi:hypothetical protein
LTIRLTAAPERAALEEGPLADEDFERAKHA